MASKRVDVGTRAPLARFRAAAWPRLGLSLGVAAGIAAPAFANGAYFPTSWGWATLAFGWLAAVGLVVRRALVLAPLERALLVALLAVTGWTALAVTWSQDVTQTVLEVERILVYLTGVGALLVFARRRSAPHVLGAVLAAITLVASYALATRLFPERLGYFDDLALNRLARPIGYWNALGLFAAMGCLLALGFAARARLPAARALAGAALPVLAATLYFTFGRAAWIALGVGLLAALAFDARRLQLVSTLFAVAPAAAGAVWLASRSDALTSRAPPLAAAVHEGHRLAPIILGLAAAGALAALLVAYLERVLPELPRLRLVYGAALWLAVAAGVAAVVVAYGSPWTIARKGYDEFTRPPVGTATAGADLNRRLFSLWGNGRADFWKAAWHDSRDHPWLGSGAGSYEQYWLQHRQIPGKVRDAHSLYMETLAELGPPGLGLLVVALAIPLAAAVRARRRRLAGAATGAYAAYLVHAGVDWDWEVPAVTLAALVCAVVLLLLARGEGPQMPVSLRFRAAALAVAVAAVGFGLVALVSNSALSASERAAIQEDWTRAEGQARKAIRWAPWSSAGWRQLGEAQLQQAHLGRARTSFRRAIAKDPGDWSLWLDLALASEGQERRRAASVALRLNPRSPEIAQIRMALGLGEP